MKRRDFIKTSAAVLLTVGLFTTLNKSELAASGRSLDAYLLQRGFKQKTSDLDWKLEWDSWDEYECMYGFMCIGKYFNTQKLMIHLSPSHPNYGIQNKKDHLLDNGEGIIFATGFAYFWPKSEEHAIQLLEKHLDRWVWFTRLWK